MTYGHAEGGLVALVNFTLRHGGRCAGKREREEMGKCQEEEDTRDGKGRKRREERRGGRGQKNTAVRTTSASAQSGREPAVFTGITRSEMPNSPDVKFLIASCLDQNGLRSTWLKGSWRLFFYLSIGFRLSALKFTLFFFSILIIVKSTIGLFL